MRAATAYLALLLCAATLREGMAQQDIGLAYQKYPRADCVDYEGFIAGEKDQFSVLTAKCPGGFEAWLCERAETGRGMIVVDHIRIHGLAADERVSPGPYCKLGGKEIDWVAVYGWDARRSMTVSNGKLRQAWIPNLGLRRFEQVSPRLLETAVCKAEQSD